MGKANKENKTIREVDCEIANLETKLNYLKAQKEQLTNLNKPFLKKDLKAMGKFLSGIEFIIPVTMLSKKIGHVALLCYRNPIVIDIKLSEDKREQPFVDYSVNVLDFADLNVLDVADLPDGVPDGRGFLLKIAKQSEVFQKEYKKFNDEYSDFVDYFIKKYGKELEFDFLIEAKKYVNNPVTKKL